MRILRSCAVSALALAAVTVVAACGSSSSSSSSSGFGFEFEFEFDQRKCHRQQEPDHDRRVAVSVGRLRVRRSGVRTGLQTVGRRPERQRRPARATRSSSKILSDASSPAQVVSNYQRLIGSDKVPLVFGPFSTLLTVPSARVASRYRLCVRSKAPAVVRPCSSGTEERVRRRRSRSRTTWSRSRQVRWRRRFYRRRSGPKTAAYATVQRPIHRNRRSRPPSRSCERG